MVFPGRFADQLLPDQLDQVSLSFLVDELEIRRGGVAANIAFGLGRLGRTPAAGRRGGRRTSREYGAWLRRHGVDTGPVRVSTPLHTARFVCTTDQDQNQIATFYAGAMTEARDIDLAPRRRGGPRWTSCTSRRTTPPRCSVTPRQAGQLGHPLRRRPLPAARPADGRRGPATRGRGPVAVHQRVRGRPAPERTGWSEQEILGRVGTWITTLGADGAYGSTRSGEPRTRRPRRTHATAIADPTGAGDAFRAGFLAGLAWGCRSSAPRSWAAPWPRGPGVGRYPGVQALGGRSGPAGRARLRHGRGTGRGAAAARVRGMSATGATATALRTRDPGGERLRSAVSPGVRELLAQGRKSFSFEFFPPKTAAGERTLWAAVRRIEPLAPSFVSVTYGAGGSSRDRTVEVTQRIAAETTCGPSPTSPPSDTRSPSAPHHRPVRRRRYPGRPRPARGPARDPKGGVDTHTPKDCVNASELVRAPIRTVGRLHGRGGGLLRSATPGRPSWTPRTCGTSPRSAAAGADYAITQMFFHVEDYLRLRDRLAAIGCLDPGHPRDHAGHRLPGRSGASPSSATPRFPAGAAASAGGGSGQPRRTATGSAWSTRRLMAERPRRRALPACTTSPSTSPPRRSRSTGTSTWPRSRSRGRARRPRERGARSRRNGIRRPRSSGWGQAVSSSSRRYRLASIPPAYPARPPAEATMRWQGRTTHSGTAPSAVPTAPGRPGTDSAPASSA